MFTIPGPYFFLDEKLGSPTSAKSSFSKETVPQQSGRKTSTTGEVWDRAKFVIVPNDYFFTTDERANRNVDILSDFCYDIEDLGNFEALGREGDYGPGEVLLGTGSHTFPAGALAQFATRIANTDAGSVLGAGKFSLKQLAKELMLEITSEISQACATYKSMECIISTDQRVSMEDKMTLCNMVVEAGRKSGIVPTDSTTFKYLEDKTSMPYELAYRDGQARFPLNYIFGISKLEPLVAKPHSPDNLALAREFKDVKIDGVYIGSCTGGKTEDFMAAAKVFLAVGKKVKVPTFLVPATHKVWMDVYSVPVPGSGGKTCSQIFEEAGCDTPASPTRGACFGGTRDTMNEPKASYIVFYVDRMFFLSIQAYCLD